MIVDNGDMYIPVKDDEPDLVRDKDGNVIYTCHMVKCSNVDKHPSKNDIVVIFKLEEK